MKRETLSDHIKTKKDLDFGLKIVDDLYNGNFINIDQAEEVKEEMINVMMKRKR